MFKLPLIVRDHWISRFAMASAAGMLVTFSLAPYNIWCLGIVSPAVLAVLIQNTSAKKSLWLSYAFGLGLYGMGASWVFISINQFGSSSVALSLLLTSLFVAGLAFAFALPFYFFQKFIPATSLSFCLGFPAVWVLGEWFRSWFLTGFPWLYLGYGHIETPLAGWAPLLGVYALSFLAVLTGVALVQFYLNVRENKQLKRPGLTYPVIVLSLWLVGWGLQSVSWTTLSSEPIKVGMAQGNIPQEKKWLPSFLEETYTIFNGLSEPLWQLDWVVWPEAAIPLLYHYAEPDLATLDAKAKETNTVFITGILYDDRDKQKFYNSIVGLGLGSGITFKTRLVPFGEYVPLEKWLRGTIEFFNLPTSILHLGPDKPDGIDANGVKVSPYICYEVVYPDLVASRARDSGVLLTVSNDAWFGRSIGPLQHLEMVQMRALETGRYVIRATNNGVSAIMDNRGNIRIQGGRFTREAIVGEVYQASGHTPFLIWRSWPIVVFCLGIIAFLFGRSFFTVLR